jgi:hypothetical protein
VSSKPWEVHFLLKPPGQKFDSAAGTEGPQPPGASDVPTRLSRLIDIWLSITALSLLGIYLAGDLLLIG